MLQTSHVLLRALQPSYLDATFLGCMAETSCYVCLDHALDVIEPYLDALDRVFSPITECKFDRTVEELFEGPVCQGGFRPLNL